MPKDTAETERSSISDIFQQLYAHFKQGTQDPPFAQADKPGTFDLKVATASTSRSPNSHSCLPPGTVVTDKHQGKAKYRAWEKPEVQKLSAAEAQKKYVQLVEGLKKKYGHT